MKRIDNATSVDSRFTQGDPATGTPATIVPAWWLNQVQEELATVIEEAGIALDGEDTTQLYEAIAALIAAALPASESVETLIVLPGAMMASDTDGVTPTTIVTDTNGLTIAIVPMPGDADSAVEFRMPMPSYWDADTLKFKVRWAPATGASAADDVRFTLAACAAGPGDDVDLALGTAIAVDDQVVAAGELHETPASSALTVAGTPAAGDEVHFRFTRDHDYGTSPMAEDAQVTAVLIQFGKSDSAAAWA